MNAILLKILGACLLASLLAAAALTLKKAPKRVRFAVWGLAALLVCVLAAVFFLTDPAKKEAPSLPSYSTALEDLPADYSIAQAKADGCLVMEGRTATAGKDVWQSFVSAAESGGSAAVRIVHSYTSTSAGGPPSVFVHDLSFDGEIYTYRGFEDGEEITRQFKYLLRFEGEAPATAAYRRYVRYVLVNDAGVTWGDIERGMFSSQSGDWIDHATVYQELTGTAAANAETLDTAISAAVLEHCGDKYYEGDFRAESHVILGVDGTLAGGTVTVYTMALYQEFGYAGAGFRSVSGSHIPTALTFRVSENGDGYECELLEYWTPRDGSYYWPDLREKFPASIPDDDLDTQKWITQNMRECYAQAVEYGQVDTDAVIDGLFEIIASSPATSSNPYDYIEEHIVEVRELEYYGEYTLRYISERQDETGLKGQLMRIVADRIK